MLGRKPKPKHGVAYQKGGDGFLGTGLMKLRSTRYQQIRVESSGGFPVLHAGNRDGLGRSF
jgi:hypothetical protein